MALAPTTRATGAPPKPAVRTAELVGMWAVECVRSHRRRTDWAAELLGDTEHRHARATLAAHGYRVDAFRVERVAHQRGTGYVRLVCTVSVRPDLLPAELRDRPLRGILDELLLASARARLTRGRLIDAAVV